MQRGIITNLSWAGLLFFLLFTLSALFTKPVDTGGVYFFDENGAVIWYATGDTAKCYVVRTTKTIKDIYGLPESADAKLKDASAYYPAGINSISQKLYDSVVRMIKNGFTTDELVRQNIIEVESPAIFREIVDRIPDDGKGDTTLNNNREYGGMIHRDNSITKVFAGSRSYPCFGGAGVMIYGAGKAEWHSNRSGTQFTSNKIMTGGCSFIQPPSKDDLEAVGRRRGYVLGMSSRLIYIYDSTGLNATLPFSWFNRK